MQAEGLSIKYVRWRLKYVCLKRLDQNHMTRYLIATDSSTSHSRFL